MRLPILGVVALLALIPGIARAQCTPAQQRSITDRRYAEARAELQAQLKRAPNDDAAMDCMGRLLLEEGESGDAVDWLEKAVKIDGKSAQHHLGLGSALRAETMKAGPLKMPFLAGRLKKEYELAVALDPTLVDARHGLLQLYAFAPGVMGGSMAKAREQAAEILKLDPMRGHLDYGMLAERGEDFAGAEKEFLAGITVRPDNAVPYNATGSFYRRRARWADATAMYEKALKANPDARSTSIAHYGLGVVHQKNGRAEPAKAEFAAALAANPDNAEAKKALASLK